MKKIKGPGSWVMMKGNLVTCMRCGRTHLIDLPLAVSAFTRIIKGYIEQHKFCKEPE